MCQKVASSGIVTLHKKKSSCLHLLMYPCQEVPFSLCSHSLMSQCPHVPMSSCPNVLMFQCHHVLMYPCPKGTSSSTTHVPVSSCPHASMASIDLDLRTLLGRRLKNCSTHNGKALCRDAHLCPLFGGGRLLVTIDG